MICHFSFHLVICRAPHLASWMHNCTVCSYWAVQLVYYYCYNLQSRPQWLQCVCWEVGKKFTKFSQLISLLAGGCPFSDLKKQNACMLVDTFFNVSPWNLCPKSKPLISDTNLQGHFLVMSKVISLWGKLNSTLKACKWWHLFTECGPFYAMFFLITKF